MPPELIHLEVDRRLGHEWDEWDGQPLPRGGDFDAPPGLFLVWSAVTILVAGAGLGLVAYLLAPRLELLAPGFGRIAGAVIAGFTALGFIWWGLITIAFLRRAVILPERLAERGLLLPLMRWTSRLAGWFRLRDRVENASVKVYNTLALARQRKVSGGELLLLIPRCLARETLKGVMDVAGKYEIPVFVATRGQLARRVIRERRPRAVVAVACERDMVSGLHDVAGRVPVLGLTLTLPSGPCKDTRVDLNQLEEWVRAYVV